MTYSPRNEGYQEYEEYEYMSIKKRSFSRNEPTRGEPCAKVARNVKVAQTADIPLTPDGLLRCRVRIWKDRKYADLRQFWEDREDGGLLKPIKTGIMLNPVEWEHLSDALPDLQAALVSQNTNFQVNMSQMRSASVCCDEEGPYVDIREYSWNTNDSGNHGRGKREPTDRGIELGKSSLRALSHASGIISSLLPGCAEPPSPPKSARLYRPAFGEAPHGPSDGVNPPSSPSDDDSCMDDPLQPMHASNSYPKPYSTGLSAYPENNATYSDYGAGVRAANVMHAAHTAYQIPTLPLGLAVPPGGYAASQQMHGMGMHGVVPDGRSVWDDSHSMQLPQANIMAPLQPHWESQKMPPLQMPPYQGFSGW